YPPSTALYTLSLHDALPICLQGLPPGTTIMTVCRHPKKARFRGLFRAPGGGDNVLGRRSSVPECLTSQPSAQRFLMALHLVYAQDRKSTRLNSSHVAISYAV